jgi:hypothetical protein
MDAIRGKFGFAASFRGLSPRLTWLDRAEKLRRTVSTGSIV